MTARPLSTVFAIPALDHGGPDKIFFELVQHLDKAVIAPQVVVTEPKGFYLSRLPATIPAACLTTSHRRLLHRYPVAALARFVRDQRPEVVVTTLRMNDTALMGRRLGLWPRSTTLVVRPANELENSFASLKHERIRLKHRIARFALLHNLRHADTIICQTPRVEAEMQALGLGDKAVVIGNGVDTDWVNQESERRATPVSGRPALIAVGRLFRQKGFDLLLYALDGLRRRFPEIHLTVLGEGPERERLEQLARRLGVDSALSLPGHVDNPFGAMRSADLLVCSSRFEGFSNAVLEALALGTPVVAARSQGAADEVIREGFNGFLAASVEPQELDEAITRAICSLDQLDRNSIIADCRSRYGIDASARHYADVIATARP